jgi:membrane protein
MDGVAKLKNAGQDAKREANEVRVPMTAGRLGAFDFVKRVFAQAGKDHLSAFAGNLAYHGLLAIFPFLLFVVSILGIVGADQLLTDGLERISYAIPAEAQSLISDQINRITADDAKGAFTIGAIVSALVALWGVSGAMRSTMEAMNVMYNVEEKRGFVKKYAVSIGLALLTAVLFLSALTLVVAGTDIARVIAGYVGPLGDAFVWTWAIVQWPVLLGLVLLAFALIYYFSPNVDQDFRWISPGSIATALLWVVFSLAFALYVNNFGSYNATYGSIAGLIVLILYMYYSSFLLLFGAEINQVIEDAHPEGKDKGERT